MATSSFDRNYVIRDPESIRMIREDLAGPGRAVKVKERDYKAESARGVQLLKQRLLNSKTC